MTLLEQLQGLRNAEDADTHYLIAATINLYTEAMYRKGARRHLTADDIPAILDICSSLLRLEGGQVDDYAPKEPIETAIGRRVRGMRPAGGGGDNGSGPSPSQLLS